MILEWLGLMLAWLTLAGCAFLFLVVFTCCHLLRLHLALRPAGVAREARLLAHPLPPDAALPHVVVQIPTFNEGALVERAIAACARLDWPRDRLHVQVCDDSTDASTALALAAAQRAAAAGLDVAVLHRDERAEFKAGALREAMSRTPHEYFAILDVDYVPAPDFLRRCMAALLAEPRLAFVQARPDFLNAGESIFTRAQAIVLDYHFGFEQATRCWSGQVLPFNGTCGIWRRAAIEAGGGWRGDTLTEDWDLSYRASRRGWHGVFVTSVGVPGELPTQFGVWARQQQRWAAGVGEVFRKALPGLLFDRGMTREERWAALLPLGTWFSYLMFSATLVAALAALAFAPSLALSLVVDAAFLAMAFALYASMREANRFVRGGTPLGRFLLDFTLALMLALYISWANFRSVPATLFGRRRVFVRTPKEGSI